MFDRTLMALMVYGISVITGLATFTNDADVRKPSSSHSTTTNEPKYLTIRHVDDKMFPLKPAEIELASQMANPKVPPVAYWERVAQCESQSNWDDKGKWGGGLGIFTRGRFRDDNMGTWERFGGEEFAPNPSGATKLEQIVVANRIAVLGYKTLVVRDPERAKIQGVPPTYYWVKASVGFDGWGCIRNTIGSPAQWAKRKSN